MLSVMIADPHASMADAIANLVDHEPGMAVVARARDRRGTARLLGRHHPDVLLVDPAILGTDRLATLPLILQSSPETKAVLIGMEDGDVWARELRRGPAVGYIPKHTPVADWRQAILRAAEPALSPTT